MTRVEKAKHYCFCIGLLFSVALFLLCSIRSAHAQGVLPDTGQTKCYNNDGEIPCPAPGEPFYGQDGNYHSPQPAYQVSDDGLVVIDMNTGLMWQQTDDGQTRNWQDALSYCEELDLAEKTDWRLPSRQELISILDFGRYNPAINVAFGCLISYYWSGSTYSDNPDRAWCVDFTSGYTFPNYKNKLHYVRCVRGGA